MLIGIGVYLQINSISLPTDENFFSNPPSRILNLEEISGFHSVNNNLINDTIPAGSLVVSVNNIELSDTFQLKSLENFLSEPLNVKFYDRVKNLLRSIYVEKQVFFKSKFEYLKSAVIIYWIKSGGTSEKSGLRPGDIIISINGRTFSNSIEADNILINASPDKPILYEILRGSNKLKLKVNLTTYNINFDAVFRYFVSAIYLFFSLLLGLKHSDSFPIRLLSFSFLMISVVLLLVYSRFGDKTWLYVDAFALCFSFAFLSHFLLYFPVEQVNLLRRKGIVLSIYSIAFVVFLAIVLSLAFESNVLTEFLTNFSFLPILAHRLALSLFFKKEIKLDKKRIGKKLQLFFWVVLLFILAYLFSLKNTTNYSYLFAFIFYALIGLFPIFLFYILSKYRFYDIYYRIKRNWLYVTARILLNLLFIASLVITLSLLGSLTIKFPNVHRSGARLEVLTRPLPPARNLMYEKIALAALFVIFVYLLSKLKQRANSILEKKFYRAQFDYKKTAMEFSELIIRNLNLKDITQSVLNEVANSMLVKKVGLIVFKDESMAVLEFYTKESEEIISRIKSNYKEIFTATERSNGLTPIEIIGGDIARELCESGYIHFSPIKHQDKTVGALLLGEKLSDTKYTYEDIDFLNIVSKNVAIAIVNSFLIEELAKQERYKKELEIAQRIQLSSLPKHMPRIDGLSIAALTIPALEVGGDFFDFLTSSDKFTLVVGDVSGKGTSAALYMSKIQGILRTLHNFNLPPLEMLLEANALLYDNIERNYFISSIVCQFNAKVKKAEIVRAGHLGLYYYDSKIKDIRRILPDGIALGIVSQETFTQILKSVEVNFSDGDVFLFITDGVVEHYQNGKIISLEDRLIQVLKENHYLQPNSLAEKILSEVCFFENENVLYDDLTIVVVKPDGNARA